MEMEILEESKEAFKDLKFGMFVHWSLFSLPAGHDNWATPPGAINSFTAEEFDPDAIVELAVKAGAKYLTFTTKHHDGFCLFSTELTDFNSVQSPAGKDFVSLLGRSCRKAHIPLFLYYSLADLHHPGFRKEGGAWKSYVEFYQSQITELCTNYGKVAGFWLDPGPWHGPDYDYRLSETYRMIRELQPGALVMGRDFFESERRIPQLPGEMLMADDLGEGRPVRLGPPSRSNPPFEVCQTLNDSWSYNPDDRNFKSPQQLIVELIHIVGRGGNLLLNLAPTGLGEIPSDQEAIFLHIGRWLKAKASSIYRTRPLAVMPWGYIVSSRHELYMHMLSNQGGVLELSDLGSKDVSAFIDGDQLQVDTSGEAVTLNLPAEKLEIPDTVVKLSVGKDGKPDQTAQVG